MPETLVGGHGRLGHQRQLTAALKSQARRLGRAGSQAAQREWEGYRDAECTLEASPYRGGSIQPLVRTDCERDLTISRIAEAQRALAAQEDK